MLKQIIIFCVLMFSFSGYAKDTLTFQHETWKDQMRIENNRICRLSVNDCGNLIQNTPQIKRIHWDRWGTETFKKNKNGIYVLDEAYGDQKADAKIKEEYEKLDYSFLHPYVKLNPYGRAPLAALVKFTTSKPAQISVRIKGKNKAQDIHHTFKGYQTEHEIPIYGLYPNYENQVELTAVYQSSGQKQVNHIKIKTPRLNSNVFYQVLLKKDKKDFYYFSFDGYIIDEYRHIRYFFNSNKMVYYFNGKLIEEDRYNGLKIYSLLGKHLASIGFPKGFNSFQHGMNVMPNGNYLIVGMWHGKKALVDGHYRQTSWDQVIELDHNTGELVRRWDLGEVLNPNRKALYRSSEKQPSVDWCHINSVQYDATDSSLLISCRHVGMLKIDYQDGHLKWVFGPQIEYTQSGRNGEKGSIEKKVLTAVDSRGKPFDSTVQHGTKAAKGFKWPIQTHDAKIVRDGVYSIFDNSRMSYNKDLSVTQNSVASIFKVDPNTMTVSQEWLKVLDDYSAVGSAVTYMPDTNEVIVFISEIYDDNSKYTYGKLIRYDYRTQEKLFEAVLYKGGWMYRVEPITFYE